MNHHLNKAIKGPLKMIPQSWSSLPKTVFHKFEVIIRHLWDLMKFQVETNYHKVKIVIN